MWLALSLPLLLQFADAVHHFQGCLASLGGVAWFFEGRAPEGHNRVSDVLVERTLMIEDETGHIRKILVQEQRQVLCIELLGNGCEAADVAEHHRDVGLPWFHQTWVNQEPPDYLRANELPEFTSYSP